MDAFSVYNLVKASITLFVVIDPVGIIPLLVGLTKDMSEQEKKRTFRLAFYVSLILLVIFAILGQEIMLFFGISVYSFKIAGGILLLLLSLEILFTGEGAMRISSKEELGAVPLAFPLLVGPGAITTTIVAIQSSGIITGLGSIAIASIFTYLVLLGAERIYTVLGRTGSQVVAKVIAVFIAAIAIQYILTGVQYYYPPAGLG
ncbi:MAG: MarC family protein [Conexivisphaerales archaeon]